jgi:hypothetical protein
VSADGAVVVSGVSADGAVVVSAVSAVGAVVVSGVSAVGAVVVSADGAVAVATVSVTGEVAVSTASVTGDVVSDVGAGAVAVPVGWLVGSGIAVGAGSGAGAAVVSAGAGAAVVSAGVDVASAGAGDDGVVGVPPSVAAATAVVTGLVASGAAEPTAWSGSSAAASPTRMIAQARTTRTPTRRWRRPARRRPPAPGGTPLPCSRLSSPPNNRSPQWVSLPAVGTRTKLPGEACRCCAARNLHESCN